MKVKVRRSGIAQPEEHLILVQEVSGSSPDAASNSENLHERRDDDFVQNFWV